MSYTHPFNGVVPDLVEDVSLKRVRTEVNGADALKVVSVGGNENLDSQGIADAMALDPSSGIVEDNSVLNYLSLIERSSNSSQIYAEKNNEVLGKQSDAIWPGAGDGSLVAIGKRVAAVTHNIYENVYPMYVNLGQDSASAWGGSGNGSLIAIEKRTSTDAHAAADVLGTTTDALVSYSADGSINGRLKALSNYTADARGHVQDIKTYIGSTGTSAWSGTGSGTLISIAKRTSNDTNAAATATGTQSDAAWSGTGDGSVIALLKGIYNKL